MQSRALHDFTASEIVAWIDAGELAATDVFEAVAERVSRLNPALNAVIGFDPSIGREEARAADPGRHGTRVRRSRTRGETPLGGRG